MHLEEYGYLALGSESGWPKTLRGRFKWLAAREELGNCWLGSSTTRTPQQRTKRTKEVPDAVVKVVDCYQSQDNPRRFQVQLPIVHYASLRSIIQANTLAPVKRLFS